ncbi:hypothetical protein DL770_004426 [Monosporascus sp. CRB-9-2]|nr:hypothetical protein DL770_004426 [Monosporascus sp. CRB-9-2]
MAILRPALATGLVGCALVGGYAAVGSMSKNGFGDAIFSYVVDPPHAGFPGAPRPLLREYTGLGPVDDVLAVLVGFFSGLFDGDVAPERRIFTLWAMTQFAACWTLLALEGLRAGNRGRLVSWTGTMGLIFQVASWTITVPLWLILHLFISPVAELSPASSVSASVLLVDLWDLAVLPLTVAFTFITPTVAMFLPSHFSPAAHYGAMALWQPFPLWHSLVQFVLSRLARIVDRAPPAVDAQGRSNTPPTAFLAQVKSVYGFVTLLSVAVQVTTLQLVFAPAAVRESLALSYPGLGPFVEPSVTFASVFVPCGPLSAPAVDPASLGSGDLAPLAVYFLQYDMYFGCGAMLLWALYLHRNAVKKTTGLQVAGKVLWWFALGGFAGALSTLLWERDTIVEEPEKAEKKIQ